MGDVMSNVVGFLKEYIWKNGFEMLSRNPFAVYKAMVKHDIDTKTARLVMVTLMSGSHELVQEGRSVDEITDHIQAEHCLNKKTAGNLATVYLELFSDENRESWSKAAEAGFDEFCEGEWSVEWDGRCDWNTKHGGSYPCTIGNVNKNRVGFDGAEPCFLCNSYKGLFIERETDCYKMIFT